MRAGSWGIRSEFGGTGQRRTHVYLEPVSPLARPGALRSPLGAVQHVWGEALAEAPRASRWADAVATLDAGVGALLLCAGAVLFEPGLVDIGVHLESDRYLVAGAVFVYAGAVLAYSGVFGLLPSRANLLHEALSMLLGTGGRFAVAAMFVAFSARAAMFGLSAWWIVWPLIPGLLATASLSFGRIARARSEAAQDHTITAQSGKTPPATVGSLLRAVVLTFFLCVGIFALGAALLALAVLDIAFIQDRPISLRAVLNVAANTLVPLAVSLGAVALLLLGLSAVFSGLRSSRRESGPADAERDLSEAEVSFAAACVAHVRDHVAKAGLVPLARALSRTTFWLFVAAIAAALVLGYRIETYIAGLYAPSGEGWRLYTIEWQNSFAMLLLTAVVAAFLPTALLRLTWRRAAEANGARGLRADRGPGALEGEVVKRVRARILVPGEAFDAAETMRVWGITTAIIALVANALVLAGVAAWWPHERARDVLYTEDAIETGEPWTLARVRYPYTAVQAMRVACGSDGAARYTIVLPEGKERVLVERWSLTARLDDAVKVDGKLRAAGVKAAFSFPEEQSSDAPVVDRMCVLELAEGADEATRAKIEKLFHLDEWYERRWRMRVGEPAHIAEW